ncbi:hypothetical protein ABZ568_10205 [Streptomyces olindensis]|uniref:Uncharacterized protein n=1 Tax=Streptomyces olindensis TaxID=358823 RepID=A0ABV2XRZ6_9ACTN
MTANTDPFSSRAAAAVGTAGFATASCRPVQDTSRPAIVLVLGKVGISQQDAVKQPPQSGRVGRI